jgi:flagellar biosynthesis/type III secretory pathway chaperone
MQTNKRFNIKNTRKCGAITRKGTKCQAPAMKNGRCRMHGGKSTGVKTIEGLEKIKKANFKNGNFTKEKIIERKAFNQMLKENREFLKRFN